MQIAVNIDKVLIELISLWIFLYFVSRCWLNSVFLVANSIVQLALHSINYRLYVFFILSASLSSELWTVLHASMRTHLILYVICWIFIASLVVHISIVYRLASALYDAREHCGSEAGEKRRGGGSRKKYNNNKRQWNCKINASHVNMKYAYFMTMRQYLKNNKRQVEVRQCTTARYAVGQWIRYIYEVSNTCFKFELNCK